MLSLQPDARKGGWNARGQIAPRAPPNDFEFGSSHREEDASESFQDANQQDLFVRRRKTPWNDFEDVKVEPLEPDGCSNLDDFLE